RPTCQLVLMASPARGLLLFPGLVGGHHPGRITMATPDKVAAVKELTELFRASNAVLITEYRGLSVSQLAQLRGDLRGTATYAVAKNTLTALAAKEAGVEGIDDLFVGPTAIAFVTGDPVEAAKGLKAFAK